ncbi:hypothetical protein DSO57_1033666 [Entomophthora muscae]|uniref:Uncharacterized protein n=1 Tax=Entomophthora muscae TaxID=34485 RepID=A0ACC2SD34_9FUNG|nr:hypothetical protein DSO57_1033666 [Entomophthora muscae]
MYGPQGRAITHLCSFPTSMMKLGRDWNNPSNLDPLRKPPSSPLPPRVYVRDSKWNPCHPNRFVSLENEDVFKNKDHYPCLPDLN